MPNKTKEVIILDPNEKANLININLLRHFNSNISLSTFESETSFREYLEEFQGTLYQVYVHEGFTQNLKALIFSICASHKDVELYIIGETKNEFPSNLNIQLIQQGSFIQEITERISY
jgi:hypothetical protein